MDDQVKPLSDAALARLEVYFTQGPGVAAPSRNTVLAALGRLRLAEAVAAAVEFDRWGHPIGRKALYDATKAWSAARAAEEDTRNG